MSVAQPALLLHAQSLPSGVRLRQADANDAAFLRTLYIDHRMAEWAAVPWDDDAKRAFLSTQYDFQQRHYTSHYPDASILVVTRDGRNVGRLHLHATAAELHIVDILLAAGERGRGTGSSLLRWTQDAVRHISLEGVTLHVELQNEAARRLYERHGFVAGAEEGAHIAMGWRLPLSSAPAI